MIVYRLEYKNGIGPFNVADQIDLTALNDHIYEIEKECKRTYQAYRRKHGINHPDLIAYSVCTIEQKDENGNWWIVSESLEYEPDFTIEDEMEGYPG